MWSTGLFIGFSVLFFIFFYSLVYLIFRNPLVNLILRAGWVRVDVGVRFVFKLAAAAADYDNEQRVQACLSLEPF